ncbi:hypothetical protein F5Y04DRAFT_281476 [Hypomontagnella monticulosa]|nr:hypothetical protein F5Y04DRAFT_281476 [Hypomontagnella monticulosa]
MPSVQPSVLLAIIAGVHNAAQAFALSSGIANVWWINVSCGTKLHTLHYVWSKGSWGGIQEFVHAISSFSVARVVFATIATMVAGIATGPLLQRGIRAVDTSIHSTLTRDWDIVKTIPDDWTGNVDYATASNITGSVSLQSTIQDWYRYINIKDSSDKPCLGTCHAKIPAAGVYINCSETQTFMDLTKPENNNARLFSIDYHRFNNDSGVPAIAVDILYVDRVASSCNATVMKSTCTVTTAVMEYDVLMENRTVSLDGEGPRFQFGNSSVSDSAFADNGAAAGPLGGIGWVLEHYFKSNATLIHENGTTNYQSKVNGILAFQFAKANTLTVTNQGSCVLQWDDPTYYMTWRLHEAMFRMAWEAGSDELLDESTGEPLPKTQTLYEQDRPALVYEKIIAPVWVAVAIMLVAVFSTSNLMWRFWRIYRPVSLSPLETAVVLRSRVNDMYDEERSFAEVKDLINHVGDRDIDAPHAVENPYHIKPRNIASHEAPGSVPLG